MKNLQQNDREFDKLLKNAFEKYNDMEPECEMTEEEIRIMDSKKQAIYNKLKTEIDKQSTSKFPIKRVLLLTAILIVVLAASFNASKISDFFDRAYMTLTGTEININTKKLVFEDYDNITNFENKEKIIVPNWLPEGMKLEKVKDEQKMIDLYFKNEDIWIMLKTEVAAAKDITKIETENNNYTARKTTVLGMECNAFSITSETGTTIHMAYWNSENTNYSMITNIPEEEFDEILRNLRYFEE